MSKYEHTTGRVAIVPECPSPIQLPQSCRLLRGAYYLYSVRYLEVELHSREIGRRTVAIGM